jgi:general secretion pathway protein K
LRNQRGFALVITLIVTALLVALVAEFVNDVYVDTSARQNFVDGQQASLLAESGVAGGIKVLQLTMASQQFTSLLDMWAKPLKLDDEQGSIEVTIEDESAKLNLNSIAGTKDFNPDYQLVANRLLKKLGLSTDLLDGVADWVDDDEVARPSGGETAYYQSLKPPHGTKNGRFDTVDELRLVKGSMGKPSNASAPSSPFTQTFPSVKRHRSTSTLLHRSCFQHWTRG